MRVLQLGDDADVAGMQALDFDTVPALRDREVSQLLRRVTRRVPHVLTVLYGAT